MLVAEPLPLVEPLLLGELELGDLVLDELLGALLEPELLGELLELLPLIPDELELPPAAPVELEPDLDLLKCASHSACEIWPSPLVSTDEKLGVLLDELPDDDDLSEWLLEVLPEADGEDDEDDGVLDEPVELLPDVLPEADGDDLDGSDDEEDDCATASDDSANITAAAVILRVLGIDQTSMEGKTAPTFVQTVCPSQFE